MIRTPLTAVGALAVAGGAWAQPPLVAELDTVATRYYENPARLDAIRDALKQAARADAYLANLVALARVSFIWGDIRATTSEQKLQAYDRGREAAPRALELAPKSAAAHFWLGTNTASWEQTEGMLRSLFLLPTVQEEIRIVLDLDPRFTAVYSLAGNVYYEEPGLLGKTLIERGRVTEGRRELQAVLDERAPTSLADWTLKDSREARALLDAITGKS